MGQTTIEWTATYHPDGTVTPGYTFNPWQGCLKVSPGCQHCYAETLSHRWGKDIWGPGEKRQRTSAANWKKPLQWNKDAKELGVRQKIFCASMADVFEDNPQLDSWRIDLLRLIEVTPRLDWLLLTKRPENVNRMIERATGFSESEMWFHSAPHVWIGTSVENQEHADERIPELLKIPAKVRFLSCEPLLGPVDLRWCEWCGRFGPHDCEGGYSWALTEEQDQAGIDWAIIGGESGPGARVFELDWATSIIGQCKAAGVSVFMKQLGSKPVVGCYGYKTLDKKGGNPDEWPEELRVREFPALGRIAILP